MPPFFCFALSAFPDIGSVGLKNKTLKKKGRPSTPVSLLWSPETTRHEPKINMVEKLVGVFVKLRQGGKKNQPPKLYAVTVLIFYD